MPLLQPIERDVLKLMLQGNCPQCTALRNQLAHLREVTREFTGAGFFTSLHYTDAVVPTPGLRIVPAGLLLAEINDMQSPCDFLIFVEDGILHLIEGYAAGEDDWPDEISRYHFRVDLDNYPWCKCIRDMPSPITELTGP
jgi:hypothetical protein